ncbi:MAG: class II aldolase/adducin family protein [Pseudomonadota bacterium]
MNNKTDKRTLLIKKAQSMNGAGLGQGSAGNLSVRDGDGFLVTPAAIPYDQYQIDDIVYMTMDGEYSSDRPPSSEWRFHRDIYREREDINAVVHAHSPACTALACLDRSIPAFHYMVAVAGGDNIRCAPYATFGTQELSDHVIHALQDRYACLLSNHGMVCVAENLTRAFSLAVEVEELAEIYCQTLQVGQPKILSRAQIAEVLEKFVVHKKLRD